MRFASSGSDPPAPFFAERHRARGRAGLTQETGATHRDVVREGHAPFVQRGAASVEGRRLSRVRDRRVGRRENVSRACARIRAQPLGERPGSDSPCRIPRLPDFAAVRETARRLLMGHRAELQARRPNANEWIRVSAMLAVLLACAGMGGSNTPVVRATTLASRRPQAPSALPAQSSRRRRATGAPSCKTRPQAIGVWQKRLARRSQRTSARHPTPARTRSPLPVFDEPGALVARRDGAPFFSPRVQRLHHGPPSTSQAPTQPGLTLECWATMPGSDFYPGTYAAPILKTSANMNDGYGIYFQPATANNAAGMEFYINNLNIRVGRRSPTAPATIRARPTPSNRASITLSARTTARR